jgi:hypothetical protein
LRRIFVPKREEVVGGWRRLHNEELHHTMYTSPNIFREMKSRGMRWAGQVARMGEMRNEYISVGNLKGRGKFEDLSADG